MQTLIQSPWTSFLLRRAWQLAVGVLTLIVLAFLMIRLIPGDPARAVAGNEATLAELDRVRERLGLDLPLWQSFIDYVVRLVSGDWGQSFRSGDSVLNLIAIRLPYTAIVSLAGILVAVLLGALLGMVVALLTRGDRRRWLDVSFSWTTSLLGSLPQYVAAALLVAVFAVGLGLFPPAGATTISSYVLPIVALSIGAVCSVARVVRREADVILDQEYMRTARGWRIGTFRRVSRYAVPNLAASTLTLSGLILTGMLGGAIVMESVFAWPGLGRGIVQAILDKDYPMIQGIVLTLGMLALLVHLCVDIVLALLDPRALER
jgi:peptide/nickel transport system permease protein